MNIDLTLNGLRLAGVPNFTPQFGTKEELGHGVGTKNLCPYLSQKQAPREP